MVSIHITNKDKRGFPVRLLNPGHRIKKTVVNAIIQVRVPVSGEYIEVGMLTTNFQDHKLMTGTIEARGHVGSEPFTDIYGKTTSAWNIITMQESGLTEIRDQKFRVMSIV